VDSIGSTSPVVEAELCAALEYLEQQGLQRNDFNLIAGNSSAPAHAHYAFEAVPELKVFWWECGISVVNLQVGFPFVRGAARQYKKKWLIDVSPFCYPYPLQPEAVYQDMGEWGRAEGGLFGKARLNFAKYTPEMCRLAGYTPEMMTRCWLAAVMSGADYLLEEASSITHFVKVGSELKLTPYGEAAKRLGQLNRSLDRGTTLAPVALLLDFHHGLEPYSCEKPWRFGQSEDGDAQVFNFFETVYPDHSKAPQPPWKNQLQYGDMLRAGYDFRPYERKILTNSNWPDMFDVVLTNANAEAFIDKKVILMLGMHQLQKHQEEMLLGLIHEGRHLILSLSQSATPSLLLEGIQITETKVRSFRSVRNGITLEEMPFDIILAQANGWTIGATMETGNALLLERPFGEGKISVFTAPYALDVDGKLLECFGQLLARATQAVLPVHVQGPPIQQIVNQSKLGYVVTLMNHTQNPWSGTLVVKHRQLKSVVDYWNDETLSFSKRTSQTDIEIKVSAFGCSVLELV
jgi:hypothetical protein